MNRRAFIRNLAAALPAGAVATQVRAETDPVRAAHLALLEVLQETVPEGLEVSKMLFFSSKGNLVAHGLRDGEVAAEYQSFKGGWQLTA